MLKPRSPLQIKKSVIFALVLREARSRFGQRRMGAIWTLIEPICHLLILSVLFGLLRGRSVTGIDFPVFVLVGMAPFLTFRNTALRLMNSPKENRSLFAYKQIKPLDTFIARVIVEFSISACVYAILVFGFAWYGFDMSIKSPIEWMLTILLGVFFSFGLGMLLSLIAHALPSSTLFLRMMFFPLYFISGVFVPAAYLPHTMLPLLLLNPFLHLLELIRSEIFPHYVPVDGVSVQYVIACTLILLFVSLGTYRVRRLHLISTKNG
ncbi:phosphate ABC transporter permease [Pseudomonas umsongensis]|uniref:Transport permease protein n=1 Tax=Pseudomonas umsongensis TaxID=198618 RepID=A0ABX4DYN7_9PSED|nr:ABC transporter permease [Pseudomonas umsongensis]OXR33492.1 phosphate ABC transporter permease [Pseudomonas umsongensis]SDS61724.1 capsular polysaccharide transport system permease protein [Pseudomonas umsongensis]